MMEGDAAAAAQAEPLGPGFDAEPPAGFVDEPPAGEPGGDPFGLQIAKFCGALVHCILLALGLMFLLHVATMGVALQAQGYWSSAASMWPSLRDALVLLVDNFALFFVDLQDFLITMLYPGDPATILQDLNIDMWGFWFPGLISLLLLTTALLGISTMNTRRPSRAIPYAFLAALLLVWQAEMNHALMRVATWGNFGEPSVAATGKKQRLTDAQRLQQHMFKLGHEGFTQMYSGLKCKVRKEDIPNRISCAGKTIEAKLLPLLVQEFCKPRSRAARPDFDKRVTSCKSQGKQMRFLSGDTSNSDRLYCDCWSAMIDLIGLASVWMIFVWIGLFAGVLSVLYVAAEPKLNEMCATARSEVMCFAVASVAVLACKVTIFADGLPWPTEADAFST